jgi:hypothetical protein
MRKEFRANQNQNDPQEIKKAIKLGNDVNRLLKTSVYQLAKTEKDKVFSMLMFAFNVSFCLAVYHIF